MTDIGDWPSLIEKKTIDRHEYFMVPLDEYQLRNLIWLLRTSQDKDTGDWLFEFDAILQTTLDKFYPEEFKKLAKDIEEKGYWLQENSLGAYREKLAEGREHLTVSGTFQSDKYPETPAGIVPLKITDEMAESVLRDYALKRISKDPDFTEDLLEALNNAHLLRRKNHALQDIKNEEDKENPDPVKMAKLVLTGMELEMAIIFHLADQKKWDQVNMVSAFSLMESFKKWTPKAKEVWDKAKDICAEIESAVDMGEEDGK